MKTISCLFLSLCATLSMVAQTIQFDYHGQRFHYFFGAAWSEFDVRSQAEWQCRIEAKMLAQRHPLQLTIQK